MTGCTTTGRLDEGNIACVVELEDIPDEFRELSDDLRERLNIQAYLWNQVKDRSYQVDLNEENGFRQELMLNPGFYQVRWFTESPSFLHLDAQAGQEALEVGADKANYLSVYIADPGKLAEDIQWMQPSPGILSQEMYSRKVQWKGELIDLKNIIGYVDFTHEQPVPAYEQIYLADLSEQVGVTMVNETDHELPWQECAIQAVTFSGVNAMLPKGVRVGQAFLDVVHKESGSYGTPQAMEGSILFGTGVDQTRAVYLDPVSGDRITVACSPDGQYIIEISYEFAVFE